MKKIVKKKKQINLDLFFLADFFFLKRVDLKIVVLNPLRIFEDVRCHYDGKMGALL